MSSPRSALAAAASPAWCSGGASFRRQQLQYRFNAAFRNVADRQAFGIRVDVLVPLRAPVRYGLIDHADLADVSAIEATMTGQVAGHGFLVGRISTAGILHYALYVDDAGISAGLQGTLTSASASTPVRVGSEPDPTWSVYQRFFQLRRRSAAAAAILAAIPLLLGGIVAGSRGVGWGIGVGVALFAWVVPVGVLMVRGAFGRSRDPGGPRADAQPLGQQARPSWAASHEKWSFGFLVLAFASSLCSLLAIVTDGALAMAYCAAIAVALGLVITVVMWPAQRRFYADLRSRSVGPSRMGSS